MSRIAILLAILTLAATALAQESPYFVAYDDHMEETGNLEISPQLTIVTPKHGRPAILAPLVELEYGWSGWWTSELYLEGASQLRDTAVFTGWRIENRFKPLARQHWINPVLYFEFEDTNEASQIRKEIVGHAEPLTESLSTLRSVKSRELEAKLILSSNLHSWNLSENFIVEKNTSHAEATEFGYALAIARPLATLASGSNCHLCRENFRAAIELYGGLGDTDLLGLPHTAHYLAPSLVWQVNSANSFRVSTAFGLTSSSDRLLMRAGYTYEIAGFGHKFRQLFNRRN